MKNKGFHLKWTISGIILLGLVFTSCKEEQMVEPMDTLEDYLVKKESYYNLSDNSLFRTIEYSYNSDRQLIFEIDKYPDTLANKETEYYYDANGNLILTLVKQTGWADDLTPIEKKLKTKYAYSSGLLASVTSFVDSAGRGYEQKNYYYTNNKLDSINHYSFSVRQNLVQNYTEYFEHEGDQLIEKGFEKIGGHRNTIYEYSNGLLTKEFNDYWITLYKYEGNLLKTQSTSSSGLPNEHIEYFHTGNRISKKVVSRFSLYSENPNEPYSVVEILFEY